MSEDNRPSVATIIKAWFAKYSEERTSELGTPFKIIPSNRMLPNLWILAKTLFKYGYTFEEVDGPNVSKSLIDICWREDKIKKMSTSEIRAAKLSLSTDWNNLIHDPEFSGIVFDEDGPEKKAQKSAKLLEIDPSDRIKMDTSDIPDPELDMDFLKDLGAEDFFVKGSENE